MKPHYRMMKVVAVILLVSFTFTNSIGYSDIPRTLSFAKSSLTREKAAGNWAEFRSDVLARWKGLGYSFGNLSTPRDIRNTAALQETARIIDRTEPNRLSLTKSSAQPIASLSSQSSRNDRAINRFASIAIAGPVRLLIPVRSELRSDFPDHVSKIAVMGAGIIAKGVTTSAISVGNIDVHFASRHPDRVRGALDAKRKDSVVSNLDLAAQVTSGLKAAIKEREKTGLSVDEIERLDAQIAEKSTVKDTLLTDWTGKLHGYTGDGIRDLVAQMLDQDPEVFIEAISEDALDKEALFKALVDEVDKRLAMGKPVSLRMIATTTSSLRVSEIAKNLPEEWQRRMVGFHPFNPVPLMKLVEISSTKKTAPEVIEFAEKLAKQMGKISGRVKDSPGFIVNRILYAYFNEVLHMLRRGEGSFKQIAKAAKDFGMPMDPFHLLDLIGHDTNFEILNNLNKGLSVFGKPDPMIEELRSQGRSGVKSKTGFYNYTNGKPEDDETVRDFFSRMNEERHWNIKYDEDVTSFDPNRLLFVMANEAARIAEEGTATVPDIELAMMLGTGFPEKLGAGIKFDGGIFALTAADIDYLKVTSEEKKKALEDYIKTAKKTGTFRSGPFSWMLRYGIEKLVDQLEILSRIYGPQYKPSHLLEQVRMGRLPNRDEKGRFEKQPYVRVWAKPREFQGPFTNVAQEAIIASQPIREGHQIRLHTILADINANGGWLARNYPINTARHHKDTATVTGSAGLMLVTEVGKDVAAHGVLKPGQLVIMLSGTHELYTLDAMGESAQAIPSFRITGYEAKIAQEGNFGQETVLNFQDVVPVSEGVYRFDELGPLGLVWPTAWHALNVLGLRERQTILVEGGSGGTGEAGVKIARDRGANVISTVSDEKGEALARENGAQEIIYRTEVKDENQYVQSARDAVKRLTGQSRGVDKAVFSSGQAMAPWHWEALREGDPDSDDDLGGQAAFFGAGATGFAHDHFGTRDSAKIPTMLRKVQKIRTARYHVSKNIDRVLIAGSDERAEEAALEAKKRGASVIVLARNDDEEARIRAWKFNGRSLQFEKTWAGTREPDGIIRVDKIAPLSKMPDFPKLLPNQPTAEQVSQFAVDQTVFGSYMKTSVIPLAKAITKIWGETVDERTGEKTPKSANVAWVFWDGEDGEKIVNPFTFVGFFTQIVFPNDTSKMHIRYHAANLWMRQNSLIFTRKAMLGVHYASPVESSSVLQRIARGSLTPRSARLFNWHHLPEAVESQGRGKNNILVGVTRGDFKTLDQAYADQAHRDRLRELRLSTELIEKLSHIAVSNEEIASAAYNTLMEAMQMVGSANAAEMAEALGKSLPTEGAISELSRWLDMFRSSVVSSFKDGTPLEHMDELPRPSISHETFLKMMGADTGVKPNLDFDKWTRLFRGEKASAKRAGEFGHAPMSNADYLEVVGAAQPGSLSEELARWLKRSELRNTSSDELPVSSISVHEYEAALLNGSIRVSSDTMRRQFLGGSHFNPPAKGDLTAQPWQTPPNRQAFLDALGHGPIGVAAEIIRYSQRRSELRFNHSGIISKNDIAWNRGWFGLESDSSILEIDSNLYQQEIGEPGKAPFVRGIQPNMYVRRLGGQVPTNRKYGSFGTWKEAQEVIKGQLSQGVRGLSIAYDLLTQLGIDPDDIRGAGEVGKNGVSVASLRDYEQLFTPDLFKQIVEKKIGVSKTINATAAILLAMYVAAAKKAGIDPKLLRGTIQNDILKEYRARNNFAFPLGGAIRLIRDIFGWSKDNVPSFNTISISGYHDREKGTSAEGELLAMFSSAIEYLVIAEEGGLNVADVAKQMSFFMNVKMNVMEEAAKFRAARRIWVKILKEGFGITDPRALQFRVQGYAGGTDLQYQKPHVNIVRDAIRAVTAVSSSLQGVNAPSFDEAHGIPTELSETVSIDTNNIAIEETGLSEVIDPFGGSYYLEAKALDLEREVWTKLAGFARIGSFQNVLGTLRDSSESASVLENNEIESGARKIVGRNVMTEGVELAPKIEQNTKSAADYRPAQLAALEELKRTRNNALVAEKLAALEHVANNSKENLMPAILEAVEVYATVGEITNVLKRVFGESDHETPWEPSSTVSVFNKRVNDVLAKLATEAKSGNSAEIEKRGFALPQDLPWVKSVDQQVVVKPGEFPFTRGTRKKEYPNQTIIINAYLPGATPVEELTDMFQKAFKSIDEGIDPADKLSRAKKVIFELTAGSNFVETVSKFRAARTLWAKLLRERYMIQDEDALQLYIVAQTDDSHYPAQKSWNNIVRGSQQALAARMGGANQIIVSDFDAPYGKKTEWSDWAAQLGKDTVGVINYETGLDKIQDPLAGSYAVEALTSRIANEVRAHLDQPVDRDAIEKRITARFTAGLTPIVGVTMFKQGVSPQPKGFSGDETSSEFFATPITSLWIPQSREMRENAAHHFASAGDLLINEVLGNSVFAEHAVRVDEIQKPHVGHATVASVGLAVTSEHFDQIRALFGNPELSNVPAGVGVDEFEIEIAMPDGSHRILDILRDSQDSAKQTIAGFIKRSGEGIQQIEIWTPDIQAAAKAIVAASANKMSGITKVDEAPREGANGTTVFFSLVTITGGKKVLVELVQLPKTDAKSELRAETPKNVTVIGAGTMGSRIAQSTAWQGQIPTVVYETNASTREKAPGVVNASIAKAVEKSQLTETDAGTIRNRLQWTGTGSRDFMNAARGSDLIIEAIIEDVNAKRTLFAMLDEYAPAHAILATNTTTISIETVAEAVSEERRPYVIGIHFQNPAHVNPLVEIVVGKETSEETVERAKAYVTALGKKYIVVKSQPGFVTSRIIISLLNIAARLYGTLGSKPPADYGVWDMSVLFQQVNEIEAGFKNALGSKLGAFELIKLIGSVVTFNAQKLLHDFKPFNFYKPAELLEAAAKGGELPTVTEVSLLDELLFRDATNFFIAAAVMVASELIDENVILGVQTEDEARQAIDDAVRSGFGWKNGIFAQAKTVDRDRLKEIITNFAQWYSVPLPQSFTRWIESKKSELRMDEQSSADNSWVNEFLSQSDVRIDRDDPMNIGAVEDNEIQAPSVFDWEAMFGFTESPERSESRSILNALNDALVQYSSRPVRMVTGHERSDREILTYSDLDVQSSRFANALTKFDVKKGDRVAVFMPNSSMEMIVGLGIWKTGAVRVALRQGWSSQEINRAIELTKPRVVVVPSRFYASIRQYFPLLQLVTYEENGSRNEDFLKKLLAQQSSRFTGPEIESNDLAQLAFSSGTSGESKIVMQTHANFTATIEQISDWMKDIEFGAAVNTLPPGTYGTHVAFATLLQGRPLVLVPRLPDQNRTAYLNQLVRALKESEAKVLFGVPTTFYDLAQFGEKFRGLIGLSRGSALGNVKQLFESRTSARVIEGYGLTEASSTITNPVNAEKPGTVGKPNPGVEVKIIDPKTLLELPVGETGELLIRAPQTMSGYWKDEEATRAALVDGFVHTGDLAQVDRNGYVTIVGRTKDIIITGGENVIPSEVEAEFLARGGIREAAVVGISDRNFFTDTEDFEFSSLVDRFGEVVVAYVVLQPGVHYTQSDIIEYLRGNLAGFKVPKRVIVLNELPMAGDLEKVDRHLLRTDREAVRLLERRSELRRVLLDEITNADLKAKLLEAFGGNQEDAENDLNARLANMRTHRPDASVDVAAARLAWEYLDRERQNVFPGDNWKFTFMAAKQGMKAPILLLDLEDAVATTRKGIARDVLILIIRAFKGDLLSKTEIEFLQKNALQADDLQGDGYLNFFEHEPQVEILEGGYRLKKEFQFHPDQMILFRPNNLRTKWSAKDYAYVFRNVGHLVDGIYMPKVFGPEDVRIGASILRSIQREQYEKTKDIGWTIGKHKIFVLTELPGGVLNAKRILSIAPEIEEAQLGVVDYTAATGGKNEVQQNQIPYMRSAILDIVAAGRETGKSAGMGITVALEEEPTKVETEKVIKLGMNRKWSVHPNHIKGMLHFVGQFPKIIRKFLGYKDLDKLTFDLNKLDELAKFGTPILPPQVFVPKDVIATRSVIEVSNKDEFRPALTSSADNVIINIDRLNSLEASSMSLDAHHSPSVNQIIALLTSAQDLQNLRAWLGVFGKNVRGVVFHDVQNASQVRQLDALLSDIEQELGLPAGTFKISVDFQSKEVIQREANAFEELENDSILRASSRIESAFLNLKRDELVVEADDDPTTKSYNYYHSLFIAMTAYAQIDAIDGYSNNDQLEEDAEKGANWGFIGKLVNLDQVERANALFSPLRAGEAPKFEKDEAGKAAKIEWMKSEAGKAYIKTWKNAIERDLLIIEDYATADQDRNLGAVGYRDPITGSLEIVDAASARIPFKQLERALKLKVLTPEEEKRYLAARARLLLALRPGGRTEDTATTVFAGQKFVGNATTVHEWLVKLFGKEGDRNRYHLDPQYAAESRFKKQIVHGMLTVTLALIRVNEQLKGYQLKEDGMKSVKFSAPVFFGDVILPVIHIKEVKADGTAVVKVQILNQDGKQVSELELELTSTQKIAVLSTKRWEKLLATPIQSAASRAREWSNDVTPHFPDQVYDFTNSSSPREMTTQVTVTEDFLQGVRVLTNSNDLLLISRLAAIKLLARSSAESVPGHVLLGFTNIQFDGFMEVDSTITLKATIPAADQIQLTRDGFAKVPVTFELRTQDGRVLATAQAMKLAERKSEPKLSTDPGIESGKARSVTPSENPQSGDFLLFGRPNTSKDAVEFPEDAADSEAAPLIEMIQTFFENEVATQRTAIDEGKVKVEDDLRRQAGEIGLLGMAVPEEFGGLNAQKVVVANANRFAWGASPSFGSLIRVHGGVGTLPIVIYGTEEQKAKYLPKLATGELIGAYLLTEAAHGSDSLNSDTELTTKAVLVKDETTGAEMWEITGDKAFITNARFSDVLITFVMTGPKEKSVIIIDRNTPGVTIENDMHKIGLHGTSTANVHLDKVRVPKANLLGKPGDGSKIGMSILNHGRTAVAAGSLGGSESIYKLALNYAIDRVQFKGSLANWGAVQEKLGRMRAYIYTQEAIVYALAALFDGGVKEPGLEASIAKVFNSHRLNRISEDGVQLFGGAGIASETDNARFYTDARVMTIFEGANEILLSQAIAPLALKYLQTNVWPKGYLLLSGWNVPAGSPIAADAEKVKLLALTVDQAARKLIAEMGDVKAMQKEQTKQSQFMALGKMVASLFAIVSTMNRTQHRLDLGLESTNEINMTRLVLISEARSIEEEAEALLKEDLKRVEFKDNAIQLRQVIAQHDLKATGRWNEPKRSELRIDVPVTNVQADNVRASIETVRAAFSSNDGARSELHKTLGIESKDAQAFVAFGRAAAFDEGGAPFAAVLADSGETVAVVAPSRSELRLISEMNAALPKGRQIYAAATPRDASRFLEAQMKRHQGTGVRVYFATSQIEANMIQEQGGFNIISIVKRSTFAALENAMSKVSQALEVFIKTVQAIYKSA